MRCSMPLLTLLVLPHIRSEGGVPAEHLVDSIGKPAPIRHAPQTATASPLETLR